MGNTASRDYMKQLAGLPCTAGHSTPHDYVPIARGPSKSAKNSWPMSHSNNHQTSSAPKASVHVSRIFVQRVSQFWAPPTSVSQELSIDEAYKRVEELDLYDPLEKQGLSIQDFEMLVTWNKGFGRNSAGSLELGRCQ